MHLIRNHKCGIETKTEMTDNLVFICFVLVLGKKCFRTGKGNLVNVFIYFVFRHTDTIIDKFNGFVFRADENVYPILSTFRFVKFAHTG